VNTRRYCTRLRVWGKCKLYGRLPKCSCSWAPKWPRQKLP